MSLATHWFPIVLALALVSNGWSKHYTLQKKNAASRVFCELDGCFFLCVYFDVNEVIIEPGTDYKPSKDDVFY